MIVLAVIVAIAAALRSTWSPCGVSMLSTLVPLAEQGRGNRWGTTAAWFVAGATLGGLTLGLVAAPAAALIGDADLSDQTVAAVAAAAALVALAADVELFGFHLPRLTRQVNEDWLAIYRPWVYAGGFGWQIGAGLATYTVTAGVFVTLGYAALTGDPATAVAIGLLFGVVRGLMVLLGARLDSPSRLRAFHRRFEAAREPSRIAVCTVLLAVAAGAAAWAAGPAGVVVVAAVGGMVIGGAGVQRAHGRSRPAATAPTTI